MSSELLELRSPFGWAVPPGVTAMSGVTAMFGIGPIELLIVGSIAFVLLASLLAVVVLVSQGSRGRGASAGSERSRIEELEAENRALKNELDRRRSLEVYPRNP